MQMLVKDIFMRSGEKLPPKNVKPLSRFVAVVAILVLAGACSGPATQRIEDPKRTRRAARRQAQNEAIDSLKLALDQRDIALAQTIFDAQIDGKITSEKIVPLLERLMAEQRMRNRKKDARNVACARITAITLHHESASPEILAALQEFCLNDLLDNACAPDTTWTAERAVKIALLMNERLLPFKRVTNASNVAVPIITRAMVYASVYAGSEQTRDYMKEATRLACIHQWALNSSFLVDFWLRTARFYQNKDDAEFKAAVEAASSIQRRCAGVPAEVLAQIETLRKEIR